MKIRINKNVLGESYLFYAEITPKKIECKVWLCASNVEYTAKVNKDCTKIVFDTPLQLKGYGEAVGKLAGYGKAKTKEVKELKLDKYNSLRVKDYLL